MNVLKQHLQTTIWTLLNAGSNCACERAISDGIYSYKHVKAITEQLVADALAAIDSSPQTAPVQCELPLTQEHHLIRCPDEYAELFAHCSAKS